jgi:EmrB/QacA subfamily drug resistance transporter
MSGKGGVIRGNAWLTLVAVTLGVIVVGLNGTAVVTALPSISRGLRATFSQLEWVTNAYLLAVATSLLIGGKLGDRFGRRTLFMIGAIGFAATAVGCAIAGSIDWLIAFRAAQGLFGALLLPNTIALVRAAFPAERLNTAVGIWAGASGASLAAGPIIGGLLVEHASWHWVFYINIPVAAAAVALGSVVLAESREPSRQRFDLLGVVALGVGLCAVVYGTIEAESRGWTDGTTLGLLVGGTAVLGAFVLIEARTPEPLLPLRLFESRSVSINSLVLVLSFVALYGTLIYLTLYLQNVHNLSAVQSAVRLLPLTVVVVFSAPLGGVLDRIFGARATLLAAMTVVGAAALSFAFLEPSSSYLHLWPGFLASGLGLGVVLVTTSNEVVSSVPVEEAGLAGGITGTAQQLGGVLGVSVLGSLLSNRASSTLADHLTAAGIPSSTAHQLAANQSFAQAVRLGAAPPVPHLTPGALPAIAVGSHNAFVSGLHLAVLVAACACIVAAALSLLLPLRERQRATTAKPKLPAAAVGSAANTSPASSTA